MGLRGPPGKTTHDYYYEPHPHQKYAYDKEEYYGEKGRYDTNKYVDAAKGRKGGKDNHGWHEENGKYEPHYGYGEKKHAKGWMRDDAYDSYNADKHAKEGKHERGYGGKTQGKGWKGEHLRQNKDLN
jgi:hypothetical protein